MADVESKKAFGALSLEALIRDPRPDDQELDAHLGLLKEARQEAEDSLTKLARLAEELKTLARRSLGEEAGKLTLYANAHLRFSGAATQGLKRAASMDWMLERAKTEREDAKRREESERQRDAERLKAREMRQSIERMILPPSDAFDELYGESESEVPDA